MPKPSTPAVWASNKTFSFTPNSQQIAQGFDYIATIGRPEGAPITDDHDWPFNQVTSALKWIMDQIPESGLKSAAFREVGTGPNQIPDMSSFSSSAGSFKLPGGWMFTLGVFSATIPRSPNGTSASSEIVTYQVPFPVSSTVVVGTFATGIGNGPIFYTCENYTDKTFTLRAGIQSSAASTVTCDFNYVAIGRYL
ncbi:MAG: hypothetical protein ACRCVE_01975 [Plesiomonas sp.]